VFGCGLRLVAVAAGGLLQSRAKTA